MRRWHIPRSTVFNTPFVVGFDYVERIVERIAKSGNDGYPPFNIEHVSENELLISVAVAGFRKSDLSVLLEDNVLTIRGKQPDESQAEGGNRLFLHRGIATRQFQRRFVLERGVEVTKARLTNGLLEIVLAQPQPAATIREIAIESEDVE